MILCYSENKNKFLLRHVTVSAIMVKENKILLVRRHPGVSEGSKYCLPGGFLDRDETISQAALREVKEETGYRGELINLFRINDNPNRKGEDRQNVDFVYLVKPGIKTSKPTWEVKEVKWFKLNDLPLPQNLAFDNYETIRLYLKYREKSFKFSVINF